MTRLVSALLICLVIAAITTSPGTTQPASPTADPSVPDGAIAADTRAFFKDDPAAIDVVQFILMTNWEMDTATLAERFFEQVRATIPTDLTVHESALRLLPLNDDQVLIVGTDRFGGPVTVILFRAGNYFGTWMAVGDVDQDQILADLYNEFFRQGFDPAVPLPSEADLPTGYSAAGA